MRAMCLSILIAYSFTSSPVRAQDGLVFQGARYRAGRSFAAGTAAVRAYSRADQPAEWHFTVRAKDRRPDSYRYHARLAPAANKGDRPRLALFALDEPANAKDRPELLRVSVKALDREPKFPDVVEAAVRQAEAAASAWYAAKAALKETASDDRARVHEAWRKTAVELELVRGKYPWHLGILRDLIGAYANLNPFEARSARGANLCILIPHRIAEFELAAGGLSQSELTEFRRTLAVLYFQIELYPLARLEIDKSRDDAELAPVKKALEAFGQDVFEPLTPFVVKEKTLTYRVTGYEAKGKPVDPKQIYHHWYFLPRPENGGDAPGRVWFTLSSQVLTREPRYYLYAHSGNQRKVIMLYGTKKPDREQVEKKVTEVVADGLRGALEMKAAPPDRK
jgi:hypothetical protein